jgi:DNA excision repair protein ERCC-4
MGKLEKSSLTIVIDSREQKPYPFDNIKAVKCGLNTGDYSILGLEQYICLERKELSDIISCMTSGRERFQRELLRMKAYPKRCIVIESNWVDIVTGNYRSKLNPLSAQNSIISWMNQFNIPFFFSGDREQGQKFTEQFLYSSANNFYQIAQSFRFGDN